MGLGQGWWRRFGRSRPAGRRWARGDGRVGLVGGAEAGFVVGDALEGDAEEVIAVAALVLEQEGAAVSLGEEQVGGAVVGEVGGEEGLGGGEVELIEMELGADVGEAGRA
jgi:hypothetical protein